MKKYFFENRICWHFVLITGMATYLFLLSPLRINAQVLEPPLPPPPHNPNDPFVSNERLFYLMNDSTNVNKAILADAKKRLAIGKEVINELKSGALIVRLRTGNNKIMAYERMTNSSSISESKKQFFEKKIAEAKDEIDSENKNLMQALNEEYEFSDVLFMPDTAVQKLIEGKQAGYFYNEQLEIDPSISLNEKPFYIAFYGPTSRATKTGEEGIVVLDRSFVELVEPFPHYTGLTTVRKTFDKVFNKKEDIYFFKLMVERFNKRLVDFYDRISEED